MGALTLKSFPFELRGWDIEKFESIDPTDGFGSSTRVYISKQQIIQIEPDHSEHTSKAWLSDKGRQFFDGIFGTWSNQNKNNENQSLKKESWQQNVKKLLKTLYLFEHCSNKTRNNYFLTVVFENLSIEMLSLLKIMEQNYTFFKVRRAENLKMKNDMEFTFQLNTIANPNQLKLSTLCLLISNNPRYEGYHLNLDLRQRYLKGNFKCLVVGSSIDLTFPSVYLGTNIKTVKGIVEGNAYACQDLKAAQKPLLLFSNELYKRTDGINVIHMIKNLSIFTARWNGINILNSTLTEIGTQSIANFLPLKKKDFAESSSFYFINVNALEVPNLKKITETKLLGYTKIITSKQSLNKLFFDQNSFIENNKAFWKNTLKQTEFKKYSFLPVKMFYENEETFINTEGLFKRTNKLITRKKTREGWKLLRSLSKYLKNIDFSLHLKINKVLTFNTIKQSNFLNFINFQYSVVEKLDSVKPSLVTQNQSFFISKSIPIFKKEPIKIKNSKTKYWLDDFFTGGKDEYSKHSLVLADCSKILRMQSTNFF